MIAVSIATLEFLSIDKQNIPFAFNKETTLNSYFNLPKELKDIHLFDIKTCSSRYNQWSGQDVMYMADIEVGMFSEALNNKADLEINKTVSYYTEKSTPKLMYTVILKNNGPDNAENIKVNEFMDQGLKVSSYIPRACWWIRQYLVTWYIR